MKLTSDTQESDGLGSVDPEELESPSVDDRWSLDSLASLRQSDLTQGKTFKTRAEIPRRLKASPTSEQGPAPVDGGAAPTETPWEDEEVEPRGPQPQWARDIIFLVAFLSMLVTFRSEVADWNQVPTGSMKPSILEGDRIFVNKLAFDLRLPFTDIRLLRWSNPKRGDIVVFFSPRDGTRLVKRVVAIPGDEVELKDNTLIINGKAARYLPTSTELLGVASMEGIPFDTLFMEALGDHVYPVMKRRSGGGAYATFDPVSVPTGHVFAMGDNRDNSADSRMFGPVPETLIVGRATDVVLSWRPDDLGSLRWERIFSALP